MFLSKSVREIVLANFVHVDTAKLTEPARSYFTLFFGSGQIELVNNVDVENISLADLFNGIVNPLLHYISLDWVIAEMLLLYSF